MTQTSRLDRLVSYTLAASTVVVAAIVIEGRMNSPKPPTLERHRIVRLKEPWSAREPRPSVSIVDAQFAMARLEVFTDFQCPFCRAMDSVLTRLEDQHPGDIARSVIHFPLSGHQYALGAATSFQCAVRQGRAAQMHHVLYGGQDKFGLTPWSEFAKQAGVTDTVAFARCLTEPTDSIITQGIDLGRKIKLFGTPAIVINGWLFDGSSPQEIEQAIGAVLKGRSPKS